MSVWSVKVSLLLLTAALLGGLLAWWLVRRDLRTMAAEQARHHADGASWRQQTDRRLAARSDPDLTPLMDRLAAIEKALGNIRLPTPEPINLRPVLDAVASIRLHDPLKATLDAMHVRLLALEMAITGNTGAGAPLSPTAEPSHPPGLGDRLHAIETRLTQLRMPEPMAAPNLQPLMASLLELQRAVADIRAAPAMTTDLTPVLQQLAQLQHTVEGATLGSRSLDR
jgi:hypothetical protein